MKVLICCDSFKDSLSAKEVCTTISQQINQRCTSCDVVELPMADGGEGTALILSEYKGAKKINTETTDAIGRRIEAPIFLTDNGECFLDVALASGLEILNHNERDPALTSSFGTGILIRKAIELGAETFYIGLGGSATNDGGMGLLSGLGYRFFDSSNNELIPIGGNLINLSRIEKPFDFCPDNYSFKILSDVENTLLGPTGATRTYAPQKGASDDMIEFLEEGMANFQMICDKFFRTSYGGNPGSGAAGGIGYGILTFLNGKIEPGAEVVLNLSQFRKHLEDAGLVITGEGRLDHQTAHGKLVHRIALHAKQKNVPTIALCGMVDANKKDINRLGLTKAFQITPPNTPLEEALHYAKRNLKLATEQVVTEFLKSSDLN